MSTSDRVAREEIAIALPRAILRGDLVIPANALGMVLFAHGSGSSRHSRRNRFVAGVLQAAGLATLLMDLLTAEEDAVDQVTRELRFDIDLLSQRMVGAVDWATGRLETRGLPVGLFGASTGAAAALRAAAERPGVVRAVVSRGGRPDLARDALPRVQAPTLLIVGEADVQVISLNTLAQAQMRAHTQLVLVPGATHLFEEPGTLETAAHHARDWFLKYLPSAP
jgi:putative phosphoribosyl transferase